MKIKKILSALCASVITLSSFTTGFTASAADENLFRNMQDIAFQFDESFGEYFLNTLLSQYYDFHDDTIHISAKTKGTNLRIRPLIY